MRGVVMYTAGDVRVEEREDPKIIEPDFTAQQPQAYTVTPAPKGHNEHTLDTVHHRDFILDLRTAPRAVRTWLAAARPTRSYGLYWSTDDPATALGRSYDILIHLHEVEAARLLR